MYQIAQIIYDKYKENDSASANISALDENKPLRFNILFQFYYHECSMNIRKKKKKKNSIHKPCKDLFLNNTQTAEVYCLGNKHMKYQWLEYGWGVSLRKPRNEKKKTKTLDSNQTLMSKLIYLKIHFLALYRVAQIFSGLLM